MENGALGANANHVRVYKVRIPPRLLNTASGAGGGEGFGYDANARFAPVNCR
jgi:hypothetical protein